jgi:hypothetical protein
MKKMPAPKRAGTMTAGRVLELIGDDPETLILAIRLLERMRMRRLSRRRHGSHVDSY